MKIHTKESQRKELKERELTEELKWLQQYENQDAAEEINTIIKTEPIQYDASHYQKKLKHADIMCIGQTT
jgi:hypothetical protein